MFVKDSDQHWSWVETSLVFLDRVREVLGQLFKLAIFYD